MGRCIREHKIVVEVKTVTRAEEMEDFPEAKIAEALKEVMMEKEIPTALRDKLTYSCGLVGFDVQVPDWPEPEDDEDMDQEFPFAERNV